MLEKLLPSIKIFLDVESLDDLHALDTLVIGSKAVLIFLTTGCLQRYFVRLEVSSAANNGIKTILVQETDDRHGCTPVQQHRSDCPDDAREAVFDSGREAILWIRAAHYKLVSVKQIVQRMIVSDSDALPELVRLVRATWRSLRSKPRAHTTSGSPIVHLGARGLKHAYEKRCPICQLGVQPLGALPARMTNRLKLRALC
jgi:hypothetical protein